MPHTDQWKPKMIIKKRLSLADAREAWQLHSELCEALPHEWMKIAWDRWGETQNLGDSLESR